MIHNKNSNKFMTLAGMILLALTDQSIACTTLQWSTAVGNMSADGVARFEDLCGLRIDLTGTADTWVEDNSPGSEVVPVTEYVARFYAITDDTVLPDGETLILLTAISQTDSVIFGVELAGVSGENMLRIFADNGSVLEYGANTVAMPKGWRALETRWSSVSGIVSFGMDGIVDLISISGLNNSGQHIAKVRLGAVSGNAAGITGVIDVDSFVSGRGVSAGLVDKSCGGSAVALDNVTFLAGTKNCIASTSIDFGERIVFDSGSQVNVDSPVVIMNPGIQIPAGAILSVK